MEEGSGSRSTSVVYDSDDEGSKDYKLGGYHPVQVGDVFLDRYEVIQKMGWGHFSTVWLCKDTKYDTFVAMKVQKSAPNYTEAAYDEIDMLLKINANTECPKWKETLAKHWGSQANFVVTLLNSFLHVGPHGKHVCLVFEILGTNLLELIKRYNYKGIPLPLCKSIARQVLLGLDFLHRSCGIIHTDLKPENVLLQLTQAQLTELFSKEVLLPKEQQAQTKKCGDEPLTELNIASEEDERRQLKRLRRKEYRQRKKEAAKLQNIKPAKRRRNRKKKTKQPKEEALAIKIADLGNGCWTNHHYSTEIQTRQYRSPEVILGINYGTSADIWSFACMIFELATGDFMFEPKDGHGFDKDDDHLAQMIETLGYFSKTYMKSSPLNKRFFDKKGRLLNIKQLRPWGLKEVLMQKYRFIETEAEGFASFLKPMLDFDVYNRASALQCLDHPWLSTPSPSNPYMDDEMYWRVNREYELRLARQQEKLLLGELPKSPKRPGDLTDEDADEEDNSWLSDDEPEVREDCQLKFEESVEYHERMLKMRKGLMS